MWNSIFSAPEIVGGVSRSGVFWRGVLVLLMGILIALKPLLATFTLAILFGCGFLVSGIWTVISAWLNRTHRVSWTIYGVLLAVCGILLLLNPMVEILALAWSVAALLLSGGVIGISICLAQGDAVGRNLFAFCTAVFGILLGVMLFIWPLIGMSELVWVVGILLVIEGLVLMVFSFKIPAEQGHPAADANSCPLTSGGK